MRTVTALVTCVLNASLCFVLGEVDGEKADEEDNAGRRSFAGDMSVVTATGLLQ